MIIEKPKKRETVAFTISPKAKNLIIETADRIGVSRSQIVEALILQYADKVRAE